uniref:Uncharacterized protein n=1 Tax=Plectus sambesii TaxID=2011161 RepID=A0A914UT76_9BILA
MSNNIPSIVIDEPESDPEPDLSRSSKQRATTLIIQLPIEQLRRIAQTQGVTSLARETEHFAGTTTFHGVLRVYQGKNYVRMFWFTVIIIAMCLFLVQFVQLLKILASKPTVSKVSFILPDDGMDFPGVTICNYNPVRKSYIEALNASGEFSEQLLDYLVQSYIQIQALYENADPAELLAGHQALLNYTQNVDHNFTINGFFTAAGFKCEELLKVCSFGGRSFDCCVHSIPVLTDMGLCYQFRMVHATDEWMRRQRQAGVIYGLQVVADFHSEEQIGTNFASDEPAPLFTSDFEDGFRFYVHSLDAISYLSTEGISVSPSSRVYSAVSPSRFLLLPEDQWGNCTAKWIPGYDTQLPYSSTNCKALCRAKFFAEKCGCSPFIFNIENKFPVCSPYEIYLCVENNALLRAETSSPETEQRLQLPSCSECRVECDSFVHHAYNSYGTGFSEGALRWFTNQNANWTSGHVRANFVVINIFFRDMAYTEYSQMQATGLTETLSDIGGNMGLFLGASVVTACEIIIYLTKISWIGISRKRREYLTQKRQKEVEKERRLSEAIEGKIYPTPKLSTGQRLRSLGSSLASSFNRKHDRPKVQRKVGSSEDAPSKKMSKIKVDDFYTIEPETSGATYTIEPKTSGADSISIISVPSDFNRANNRRRSEMPVGSDLIQLRINLDTLGRPRSLSDPEAEVDHVSTRDQSHQQHRERQPVVLGQFLTVPEETREEIDRLRRQSSHPEDDN